MLDALITSILNWFAGYLELWYQREKAQALETKVEAIKFNEKAAKECEVSEVKIEAAASSVKPITSVSDWNHGL